MIVRAVSESFPMAAWVHRKLTAFARRLRGEGVQICVRATPYTRPEYTQFHLGVKLLLYLE